MSIPETTWRDIYANFDPTARIEFEDGDLFVGRPGMVAQEIADDLQLGLEPQGKWVVCGAMGSGKSSELVHLARLLRDTPHAVVGLDLPRSVARVDRVQPAEVLYLVGLAAVRTAQDLWSQELPAAAIKELHDAFKPLLSNQAREIKPGEILQGVSLLVAHATGAGPAAAAAASGAARAAAALLPSATRVGRSTPLGGTTRPTADGDPDLDRLCAAVSAVLDEFAEIRRPVVLVDGLDKIQELRSIRDLFSGSRLLSLPRAPVVYTGPITLMLATEWQAAAGFFRRVRLTNVVARPPALDSIHIEPNKIDEGQRALRQVVEKRLRRVDLSVEQVFTDDSLERLISTSGGLLRDLIHLVQRAVRWRLRKKGSDQPITKEAAEAAIVELRREYEITLTTRRVDELVHVARHGEPTGSEASSELLLGGYVLPYANGRVWFEPHPILRGLRPNL